MKALSTLIALAMLTTVLHAAPSADAIRTESGITGGIAVHLGCGDGRLTAALHKDDRLLVQGLDTDAGNVEKAKAHMDSLGIYGKAWAELYDGRNLPHGDNMVNLIVVDDSADVTAREIDRVLAPLGVLIISQDNREIRSKIQYPASSIGNGFLKLTKPYPSNIDDWTHYLYDASGNAVSRDKEVRRPRHVQWYAGPRRSRHHDALASMSIMTSSGGRVFYIFDEGSTSLMHRPPHWKLTARDAFNGKLLWKRDIPTWMTHLYNFRAGPKQLSRRLVSVDDSVFTTLAFSAPAVRLDAASGKTVHTYEGSDKAEELVYHNGMLLVVTGDPEILISKSDKCYGYWEMSVQEDPTVDKTIAAYDADTGAKLWSIHSKDLRHLVPLSLIALGDNVFYMDNEKLHCVEAASGKERWASPFETEGLFLRAYAPTVVAHGDVVMCLKWNTFCGFSIETGKKLWENKGSMGFGAPADLFVIGGKAWTLPMTKSIWRDSKRNADGYVTTGINIPKTEFLNQAKTAVSVDIHTGKIIDLFPFQHTQHHHRCYRNKATEDVILIGHSGIQVADLKERTTETHRWVRGLCQYGIMPANGYLYAPPDTCQCYNTGKINGFFALSEKNSWADIKIEAALGKGPAYRRASAAAKNRAGKTADWATYRGNSRRSGSTSSTAPERPKVKWTASIGDALTAPVVSADKVFVADRDAYTVHCLNRKNGKPVWKYLANGPVDSPPTIYKGLCIFGCGDGSVYCLDAESGTLAWRFKTSKIERRIGYEDRLESPLRVSGSVLVQDDTAYFAAGYSSNLDGGIRVYGVDVTTGEERYFNTIASGHWGDERGYGFLADILSSDGTAINMRNVGFDAQLNRARNKGLIVLSTKSLLEDRWFHRQDWKAPMGGKGQLVVFNDSTSFSVVNPYTGLSRARKGKYKQFKQDGHHHQKFTRYEEEFFPVGTTIRASGKTKRADSWSIDVKFQPRAMVLAADKLCTAGWVDAFAIETKTGRALDPKNPDPHDSYLRIYSADRGKLVSDTRLKSEPVFDGMAVAGGELYLSLKDGTIVCFE